MPTANRLPRWASANVLTLWLFRISVVGRKNWLYGSEGIGFILVSAADGWFLSRGWGPCRKRLRTVRDAERVHFGVVVRRQGLNGRGIGPGFLYQVKKQAIGGGIPEVAEYVQGIDGEAPRMMAVGPEHDAVRVFQVAETEIEGSLAGDEANAA